VTKSSLLDERIYARSDPFDNLLIQIDELCADPQKYYHIAAIINSTGTGKTKAAVDICKVRRAVYIGLCEPRVTSTNLPVTSSVYSAMFDALKSADDNRRNLVASKILYTLQTAAGFYTPTELYEAQFANFQYHVAVQAIWNAMKQGDLPSQVKLLSDKAAFFSTAPINRSIGFELAGESEIKANILTEQENLLVIIDEAMLLVDPESSPYSCIRVLRRTCTLLNNCFLLLLSTSSTTAVLPPSHFGSVSSSSVSRNFAMSALPRMDFPVLHNVCNMNIFPEPWHPWLFGRPLWASLYRSHGTKPNFYRALLQYASKLLRGPGLDSLHMLAIFGSRFALTARRDLAADLVRGNLAVVRSVEVENDGIMLTSCYYPEPLLAHAAMLYLMDDDHEDMLDAVSKGIYGTQQVQLHKGNLGEVMVMVYISAAVDKLRSRVTRVDLRPGSGSFVGMSVDVVSLLTDVGVSLPLDVRDYIAGYEVNFTHVYRRSKSEMNMSKNNIRDLYLRFAAVYASSCFQGIDVIVPMYNCTKRLVGLLLIQSKNEVGNIAQAKARLIIDDMKPSLFMADCDLVCIRLLVTVGSCEHLCFLNQINKNRQTDSFLGASISMDQVPRNLRLNTIRQSLAKILKDHRNSEDVGFEDELPIDGIPFKGFLPDIGEKIELDEFFKRVCEVVNLADLTNDRAAREMSASASIVFGEADEDGMEGSVKTGAGGPSTHPKVPKRLPKRQRLRQTPPCQAIQKMFRHHESCHPLRVRLQQQKMSKRGKELKRKSRYSI
jgi:hypothetical protein